MKWWDMPGRTSEYMVGTRQRGHLSKGPFSPCVERVGVCRSGDNCSYWKRANVKLD